VQEQPIEAKRRTGYLPETPPLYPDMTVRDYLTFCARIKGVPRSERKQRIATAMEKTRVADMAGRHCGKLSKGYKQRVGLAQALLHNPDVLILDEPTAGLDPKQIIETRQLIKQLAGDHTIILSTHILPEVSQTCQRVVDHQPRQGGRGGHAGQPDGAAARLGEAVRAARRHGRRSAGAAVGRARRHARAAAEAGSPAGSFEVESEEGRDVRRDLAPPWSRAAGACWSCGPARQPRRRLPAADQQEQDSPQAATAGGGRHE